MPEHGQSETGGRAARQRVGDHEIGRAVREALLTKLAFQTHPIDVFVQEGVVTLRGAVDSAELRQEAAELAVMAPGVRDVINKIDVTGEWD